MIVALNAPPAPFVAEHHHFAPGVALIVVGFVVRRRARGARGARAGRAAAAVRVQHRRSPTRGLQQMLDESAPYGVVHAYNKSLYLDDLSDEAIDVVAERLPAKTSPMSLLPIFPLGGAFADVGDDDTAFGGRRSARFAFNMDAIALDPEGMAADRDWVRSLWESAAAVRGGRG